MKFRDKKDVPLLDWEVKAENPCDRCGNQSHHYNSLYFPYKGVRIYLCDICFLGIALGLKFDIEKVIKKETNDNLLNT